jgi:hypothetical protein
LTPSSPLLQRARNSFTDPEEFQRVWLGRKLWARQGEIARSVSQNALTAVKGCHASGKTYTASGLPLGWLINHQEALVVTTAPTLRQVKTFWREIAVARNGAPVKRILPEPSTTGLEISEKRYAIGASSSAGVNIQGFHNANVLIIADEAPGIESEIWQAIEGIRAGGNVHVLKLGNPVVPSGEFYDAFTKERKIHNCITISAFDTPNLQHETENRPLTLDELVNLPPERIAYAPFPSLVRRAWVIERYHAWGPNHPQWASRVLGEFPKEDPYSVFPLTWIERSKREPTPAELGLAKRMRSGIQVGIDVAGPGHDETCLTARIGGIILRQEAWADPDPRGPVLRVLGELKRHPEYPLGYVVIDTVGIGYNFALHICDNGFAENVFGFNAGRKPIDVMQFQNAKAEVYFTCRDYFSTGEISGLGDVETEAQLSTLRYRENSRGLIEIETKEQRNKRGIPGSPDRAESLIMAFMRVVPLEQTTWLGGMPPE